MRLLFFFISMLLCFFSYGQKQGNIWYFGDGYGLDFNTEPPTLLNDGQTEPHEACGDEVVEGTASIADSSGNLLFYTDGQTVWNKEHQPMPNGTGLMGGISSTQAALIVPKPNSDTEYFLFTTDDFCNGLANGLRYSLVDICSDNGLGDVVSKGKNILLKDTVAEKLAAVRHANGVDYWILTHEYFSNNFYAFQVTPQGIEDSVVSSVGSVHEGGSFNQMSHAMGQMKVSANGTRIGISSSDCGGIFEIFDFNSTTGAVSNPLVIPTSCGPYGLAFSPDGNKLYSKSPVQYDLLAGDGNLDSIITSAYQYTNPNLGCNSAIQLGPDGKIYLYNCNNKISVINFPNLNGWSSNAEANVYVMQTNALVYGLPSMIAGYDYTASGICDATIGLKDPTTKTPKLTLRPNPANTTVTLEIVDADPTTLTITDILGKEVCRVQLVARSSQLNVSHLQPGVYTVAVTTKNGQRWGRKLVVQRP